MPNEGKLGSLLEPRTPLPRVFNERGHFSQLLPTTASWEGRHCSFEVLQLSQTHWP